MMTEGFLIGEQKKHIDQFMTTVFYCERRSQRNCIVIPVYLLEVKKAARAAACILWRYWRGARRNILKTMPEQDFCGNHGPGNRFFYSLVGNGLAMAFGDELTLVDC